MTTTTERGPMEQWIKDHRGNFLTAYVINTDNDGPLLDFAREQDARLAACVAALEEFLRRTCVCGHAKEERDSSHYYGDRTMSTPCQHCDCKQYTQDYRYELDVIRNARAALRRARGETPG